MVAGSSDVSVPVRAGFELLDWIVSGHAHEYLDEAGRSIGEDEVCAGTRIPGRR
jgi:hypothetical protein